MPSFEYDRRYVDWALGVLESYLLANEVYWHVDVIAPSGEPAYPMLTLEGMLLAMQRMRACSRGMAEQHEEETISLRLDVAHTRWRVAWEKKAQRGFMARLTMWLNFLEEYQERPEEHADRYRHEVRLRVFLEILGENLSRYDSRLVERLVRLDIELKTILIPGDFIWDDVIQTAFPEERYWYLYGRLPYALSSSTTGQIDISGG